MQNKSSAFFILRDESSKVFPHKGYNIIYNLYFVSVSCVVE